MQTGVPEGYLSIYMMVNQENCYHLFYLFVIWAAVQLVHTCWAHQQCWAQAQGWRESESSRGPGQWRHYGEPAPSLLQWALGRGTFTVCVLSPFSLCCDDLLGLQGAFLRWSGLTSCPASHQRSLKMSSDGELLLSQESWLYAWIPLWKKVCFYAKTNSVTPVAAWQDPSFNPESSKLPDFLHIASISQDDVVQLFSHVQLFVTPWTVAL